MLLKTQARAATAFFVGVALCISTVWAEALDAGSNPCVSRSAELGDSAFWANTAVAKYADGDYQAAVTTVDACFGIWGSNAGQQQKEYMRKALNVRARAEYQPEQKQRFTKIT